MKWYQSDVAKLAAIAIGSIVVFVVLTKYQLFSSEGYDAMLPQGGLGAVPTNSLLLPTASQRMPAMSAPASVAVTPAPGTVATGSPLVQVPVSGPGLPLADPVAVDDGLGIKGFAGTYADRPKDCFPKDQLNAEDLLPKDPYSQWAAVNPDGQGDLKDRNFLSAGFNRGIDTQGSSLRNASRDLRPCPSNPMIKVSPWMQSTITPEPNARSWDIIST